MSAEMHPHDRYPDAEGFGAERQIDLPELPIPRPGEAAAAAPVAPLDVPRRLGGGASFTAAGDGPPIVATAPIASVPEPVAEAPAAEPDMTDDQRHAERCSWELAARLTAGMLANPNRSSSTVKDAMGLFDQFLHEMHAYGRIARSFDPLGTDTRRRQERGEYYQAAALAPTAPLPGPTPVATPKPAQPRPPADYQAIPQARYHPGSMAGAPPPEEPAA